MRSVIALGLLVALCLLLPAPQRCITTKSARMPSVQPSQGEVRPPGVVQVSRLSTDTSGDRI